MPSRETSVVTRQTTGSVRWSSIATQVAAPLPTVPAQIRVPSIMASTRSDSTSQVRTLRAQA